MKDSGLKITEIADKLGIQLHTERCAFKRFKSTGLTKDRQWTVRPRVTNAQDHHSFQDSSSTA